MNVQIENISKSFDRKTKVLEGLNLNIESGSLTTLLGLSGCGKTTFLRIIAGLEKADTGRILMGEKTVYDAEKGIDESPFLRNVSFVFQDFALWPNMTVLDNVIFALDNRRKDRRLKSFQQYRKEKQQRKEQAMKALSMVKMEEYARRYPNELSGGQKQRVSIARAISISPDVILFDEPFSALDALLRQEMRIEIRNLIKELGITAIFVTHDQEEAMAISDQIVIMNKGRIEEQNTPEEIYWHPKTKFVSQFIGKPSFLDETHFLRPEDLMEEPSENKLTLKVLQSSYNGGNYTVLSKDDKGREFTFRSGIDHKKDEILCRYYRNESVREVRL